MVSIPTSSLCPGPRMERSIDDVAVETEEENSGLYNRRGCPAVSARVPEPPIMLYRRCARGGRWDRGKRGLDRDVDQAMVDRWHERHWLASKRVVARSPRRNSTLHRTGRRIRRTVGRLGNRRVRRQALLDAGGGRCCICTRRTKRSGRRNCRHCVGRSRTLCGHRCDVGSRTRSKSSVPRRRYSHSERLSAPPRGNSLT
jgi:hypothetical protein